MNFSLIRKLPLAIGLLVLLSLQQASLAQNSGGPTPRLRKLHGHSNKFVPGEVIVTYKGVATSGNLKASMKTVGSNRLRQIAPKMVKLNLAADVDLESAIEELAGDPAVESAQPNYIYHALSVPSDPKLASTTVANAGLSAAWDRITDCSSVTVAVLDTGVNSTHEDLVGNMWDGGSSYPNHGYDFVDDDNDPKDQNGHGTHVAGIIGASANNGVGSAGVCWRANIMALRALDETGSGTTADIAAALVFAGNNGAKVVNMSLGTSEDDPAIKSAITTLNTKGIVVVAAAGNDGTDNDTESATYPCNYTLANVICVAAIDANNALASFSNTGATSVDVGAPGVGIDSSYAGTETYGQVSFASGGTLNWNTSGSGWAYNTANFGSGLYPMLLNPSNWNRTSARYANSMDAQVWKTFNLSGVDVAWFELDGFLDVSAGDTFSIYSKNSGGNPFSGGNDLDTIDDFSSGASGFTVTYPLADCRTTSCSIGFRLQSGTGPTDFGVGLYYMGITTLKFNNTSYERLDGTSMATPFVAGIATMLFAYNPSYTAADVVAAIKGGGKTLAALSGKTTTGKAANADGSLRFIVPPTGVTASVE